MIFSKLRKSFSFRLTLICFLAFLSTLVVLRIMIYQSTLSEAENEIIEVLKGQFREIDDAVKDHGAKYALDIIRQVNQNDTDQIFAIIYRDKQGKILEGNIDVMPEYTAYNKDLIKFVLVDSQDSEESLNYIGKIKKYPDGAILLVAHDTRHLEKINEILLNVLVENLLLSLAAALLCSALVTYLVSRRLKSLNRTCLALAGGDLEARAKVNGSNDEFDMLSSNFNYMLSWINRLILNIKGTTDNLAHDMRTPLNRHRIRLQSMMHLSGVSDELKAQIQESAAEIDKIVHMFNSILNISRAETKSGIDQFVSFYLSELMNDVLDIYMDFAEEKGIEIKIEVPEDIKVTGDRQLFAQGLANIIDNAIKYTPVNGRITFSAYKKDGAIFIEVADTGPGIPEEYFEKVRERFFRLETSRTTEGTGLGLSLVDAVVKLHNGELEFSNLNPGLKVLIKLPG